MSLLMHLLINLGDHGLPQKTRRGGAQQRMERLDKDQNGKT